MTVIRPRNRRVAKLAVVLLAAALFGAPAAAAVAARTSDSPSIRPPAADAVPVSNGAAAAPRTVDTTQQIVGPTEAVSGNGQAADRRPGHDGDGSAGGPGLGDGLGDAELDALGLGEADGALSVADLLGPGGVYLLNDGDSEIRLRLLDPADAATTAALAGMALHPDGAESALEDLAAGAATAYAPAANATGTVQRAAPGNWLASDSGQLFLLVGGVNVIFEPHVGEAEASAILASHGVTAEHVAPLGELTGGYLIRTGSDVESLQLADALSSAAGVAFAAPNLFTPMSTEASSQSYASTTASTRSACTPYTEPWPDELSACLWHLKADTNFRYRGADPTIDINLGNVWDTTMGAGVTVAIIDQTWEATHEDLRDNVDLARSHVWGGFTGENQAAGYPSHGTAVAGIVGARDNTVGGRGVAPRATLVNYNLLDAFSTANQATAVTLNRETVAVYNLGYSAPGYPGAYPWGAWHRAVDDGTRWGFGGKGSSYVKVAGNGSSLSGSNWATLDEANNHRGMIAVCAVDYRGRAASYSERGPSLWVCAPSGDGGSGPAILVPMGKNGYGTRFGGTSASAPMVSGVIALMRSANTDLTWRDVKVILANTAQKNHASHSSWMSGAAKYGSTSESYSFSNQYGFGTVDAQAAVQATTNWTLLPEMLSAEATASTVTALPSRGNEIELSIDVDPGDIDFTEHVQISLTGDIYDIRDYEWTLVSPTGAESLLAPRATECRAGTCALDGTFRFGSSRHLGEDPSGTWKLKVRKYAADITHCVSGSDSYYVYWGIAQFCRKYRSYDQTVNAVQIVVTGHSSAAVSLQPVKVSVSPATVAEGAEVEVSVTIDGAAPTQDVVIPLEISAGTATAAGLPGADYTALASITVPAGASSASAKLATVDDDEDEPDETFTVGLGTLPPGYRPVTGMPKVTITDDDSPPAATLHAERTTVAEGDFVMITASLSHPSSQDVTLDVSAAAVAPAVAADGSMSAWTKLTVAPGTTASTGPVAFIAAQNDVDEPLKEFRIAAAVTGGDIADPASITVTIDDDAQPVVRPAGGSSPVPTVSIVADGNVIEGDTATFTLVATPRPTTPLQVSVMSSLWTKLPEQQANKDKGVTAGARTVTIPVTGSAKLAFSSTDDEESGFDLHLTAALQAGSGYTVSSTADTDVVVVFDDEYGSDANPVGTVSVGAAGGSIVEGEDAAFTITWNRPARTGGRGIRVTWSFDGDFADDPARTATFWPGKREMTRTFSIGTLDDGNAEAGGSVTFRLLPYWDLGYDLYYSVGTPDRATISIADNDVAAPGAYTVAPQAVAKVRALAAQAQHGTAHVNRWNRVLVAFGEHDGSGVTGGPMTAAEAQQMADAHSSPVWDEVVAELTALEASVQQTPPPPPVVSVTAGGDVTEGGDAVFTVSASPAPAANLDVNVTVSASGDFGATTGQRTVTISAGAASAALTVATTGDDVDEADGSVTVTVDAGSGYTVSSAAWSAIVAVSDDDDPPPVSHVVDAAVVTKVQALAAQTQHGTAHVDRWRRALAGLGALDPAAVTGGAMTAAEAQQMADQHSSPVWDEVVAELTALEASAQQTPPPTPPPPLPAVSVTSAAGGTEGDPATFTVTASPAPAADLTVDVTVAAAGDFGYGTLPASVIIPASGTVTVTVTTADDAADEADGTVTLTLNAGSGYTVGTPSAQTVTVADDDPPPTPQVSITGNGDVTEGTNATFTLTASPAPIADLDVTVTIAAAGDYGVTGGSRTVTITSSGSATLTVATTGDSADEPDGTITATLLDGAGYDPGTAKTATVTVTDDDDPPPPPDTDEASPDEPEDAVPAACAGRPTLSISSPAASRNDQTVDFEVSLSCIPSRSVPILVAPLRDGRLGENMFVSLSAQQTTATVTLDIGTQAQLGLTFVWGPGVTNRSDTTGNVDWTD